LQNGTAAFRLWTVIYPLPCDEEFDSASSRFEASACARLYVFASSTPATPELLTYASVRHIPPEPIILMPAMMIGR